jgi:LAO/AO transport system kinase
MTDKRKPEWAPDNAGSEYASRIVSGNSDHAPSKPHTVVENPTRGFNLNTLVKGVCDSDRSMLSRAITLIESNSNKHFQMGQELLKQLLPLSGKSVRIGITGVPGAGKSSFIDSFGMWLIDQGHKVAVLAIDPSSSISKGSILGDKTRMENLSRHPNSFIRPSPNSGVLGGVASKTRESIILCEAAGFDVILIETVGVGQSETTVRSMVDFFLLMQIAGAGDELQGIKKGIIELADLIVINKADGDNIHRAELAMQEYNNVLHYLRQATEDWHTKAVTASAINKTGIKEIWDLIRQFCEVARSSGSFDKRRIQQSTEWFDNLIKEYVLHDFFMKALVKEKIIELKNRIAKGELPVALAVSDIMAFTRID